MNTAIARPTVFISYSRKDGKWLDELTTMLAPVVRAGIASVWWDKKIRPSQIWRQEIDKALASARLAILLVSPNFLASDFIQDEEFPFLIEAARSRGVKLLWVLVSPCLYEHSPLQDIEAAHDLSRPLSKLRGAARQEALVGIGREVVEALGPEAPPSTPGVQTPGYHENIVPEGTTPPPRPLQGSIVPGSQGFEPLAGDLPLHNLPYPPLNDLFTGRKEELDALEVGDTAAITQSTALSGLGGIGKTRLAVEYAWRSGNRYTAAWFVRADSPENLRRNLAALAGPELMNLPEWETRIEEKTVAAVKRWLREHPGWLMILDNVDTPEAADAVLEVLPSLSKGRVLITSRLTSWPATVRKHELYKLSHEDAVRFLLHRTEEGRTKAADDDRQALALAEALDGLPLALEQAAAFILRRRMRLADYLRAWEQERSEVLKWHDPRVMEYPASVAVTWQQTFHRLSPTSAALLRLMAFLAPDPIPVDMFEQGAEYVEQAAQRLCEEVGKEPDGLSIQAALDELAEYSMISRLDGEFVVVHRMVQEVLRSQIPEEHRRNWIEGALRIVDDAVPGEPDDVRTWPVWDRLRPHVAEAVARADETGIGQPTSRLMNDLGVFLSGKAVYSEAERLLRRALSIDEACFGTEHPYVATRLHNLSYLLQVTGRLEESEPLIRRALAIADDKEHPLFARMLNNLALLLRATGRPEEAEPLVRRALDIDETSMGTEHPSFARNLTNLALLLEDKNQLQEAELLLRRALDILEKLPGDQHPKVAVVLNNLAWLLEKTNRLEEAEPLIRRALAIDEAFFGNQHPNIARQLGHLARFLQKTNRLDKVEPLMRQALAIDEATLGPEHQEVATDLGRLAVFLWDTSRPREAEPLMRRALGIYEKNLGRDHPWTQRGRRYLEDLLAELDQETRGEET